MAKALYLILFIIFYSPALYAGAIPGDLTTENQISTLTHDLSNIMSLNTASSPRSIGADIELETSVFYKSIQTEKLLSSEESNQLLLEPLISLKKGLYWDIDIRFSAALPIQTKLSSGYSAGISQSYKVGELYLKPEFYIFHTNFEDRLSLSGTGITLILFKEFKSFFIGLGGNYESNSGEYKEVNNSNASTKVSVSPLTSTLRLGYIKKFWQVRLSYNFEFDKKKSEALLAFGFLL